MSLVALNPFALCAKALKHVGNVMVLVTLSIFGLSVYHTDYSLVRPFLRPNRPSPGKAFACVLGLIVINTLVIMALWCYFTVLITDPGRVPRDWHPFETQQQAAAELNRVQSGVRRASALRFNPYAPPYGRQCQVWKPPRTHHCSSLGYCVLRMDHYCVWTINTVGLLNYKAFLLFVMYTWLAAFLGALIQLSWVLESFKDPDVYAPALLMVTFCIDGAMGISLTFFAFIHLNMTFKNKTSIEMWEKDGSQPWPFDRGWRKNAEEVFGRTPLRWFVPVYNKSEKEAVLATELGPSIGHRDRDLESEGLVLTQHNLPSSSISRSNANSAGREKSVDREVLPV